MPITPPTERTYIDLIRRAEGKWATWEPSIERPEVGDYGIANKDTGEFEKEGRIYSDEFARYLPDAKEQYPPQTGVRQASKVIQSAGVEQVEGSAALNMSCVEELVNAPLKGIWRFKYAHSTVLLLVEPVTIELRRDDLLDKLAEIPMLKDYHLVTSIVQCPAYTFYISDRHE
ncbi:hypothetical protein FRB94_011626 [Tulasnella sp. JGI-2019a]|nr:hypothetical protein FRB94_011626 [Tulasnella sp. JGI-2019a]